MSDGTVRFFMFLLLLFCILDSCSADCEDWCVYIAHQVSSSLNQPLLFATAAGAFPVVHSFPGTAPSRRNMLEVRAVASIAPGAVVNSNFQYACRSYGRAAANTRPRMLLTPDSSKTREFSWKPPWEARSETRGVLAGRGYDTAAMDSFFVLRPERTWARLAQVCREGSRRLTP